MTFYENCGFLGMNAKVADKRIDHVDDLKGLKSSCKLLFFFGEDKDATIEDISSGVVKCGTNPNEYVHNGKCRELCTSGQHSNPNSLSIKGDDVKATFRTQSVDEYFDRDTKKCKSRTICPLSHYVKDEITYTSDSICEPLTECSNGIAQDPEQKTVYDEMWMTSFTSGERYLRKTPRYTQNITDRICKDQMNDLKV